VVLGSEPSAGRDAPARVLVALGGNAIAAPAKADAAAQQASVEAAMEHVADLVAAGHEVALTHGNGPQVGNLMAKNEIARDVVPPVPLDWCVAQTQATIAYLIVTALEHALAARGVDRAVVPVLTRVVVDPDDRAWRRPSKPVGRYLPEAEARRRVEAGEHWEPRGARGWRRNVASPDPRELLEADLVVRLIDDGAVVVAAGGGGIPMVRSHGRLVGVEAVVDKDLSAALLGRAIRADRLVIATDVDGVALGFGTPKERWLERVTPQRLRRLDSEGHFASGSMRPKVEACARFVEHGGRLAVIASLDRLADAAEGRAGTIVVPEESAA
jgi:carbamate kinase